MLVVVSFGAAVTVGAIAAGMVVVNSGGTIELGLGIYYITSMLAFTLRRDGGGGDLTGVKNEGCRVTGGRVTVY